jgi:hypothetical protein
MMKKMWGRKRKFPYAIHEGSIRPLHGRLEPENRTDEWLCGLTFFFGSYLSTSRNKSAFQKKICMMMAPSVIFLSMCFAREKILTLQLLSYL